MLSLNSLQEPQVLATLGFALVLAAVLLRRLVVIEGPEFDSPAHGQTQTGESGGD